MKLRHMAIVASMMLLGGMVSQTHAVPLTGFCATDGPGQCEKSLELDGSTLKIILKNTSPAANGGFITADAFDLAGAVTVSSFASTDAAFSLVGLGTTGGSINTAPDGNREFVISTQSAHPQPYLGAGNPTSGISVGETVTFTLGLSGDLTSLTQESIFASELVRFRGFVDGSSDKDTTTPGTPGGQVPEPSTVFLFGTGMLGLGFWRFRKGRQN